MIAERGIIMKKSPQLYNADLAPTPADKKTGDGLKYSMSGQMMYKVYLAIRLPHLCSSILA